MAVVVLRCSDRLCWGRRLPCCIVGVVMLNVSSQVRASDGLSPCHIISPHGSSAALGEVIDGSSFMIVRSRVSVSASKLLCPAVVMK